MPGLMKNVPIASEVAADLVATNQDTIDTAADRVQTGLDVVATTADVVLTNADVVLTNADVVLAEADKVQTGLDRAAVAADLLLTAADTVATAADLVATNADVVSTNADVVLTAADVVTTANKLPLAGGIMTGTTTLKGITETEPAHKTVSFTVDLSEGTIFELTGSGNITVTMPAVASGKAFTVINSSTGTLGWGASPVIKWASDTVPTDSGISIYSFISNGTFWYGMQAGSAFTA